MGRGVFLAAPNERAQGACAVMACSDCGESPGYCREVGDFYVLMHDYGDEED